MKWIVRKTEGWKIARFFCGGDIHFRVDVAINFREEE